MQVRKAILIGALAISVTLGIGMGIKNSFVQENLSTIGARREKLAEKAEGAHLPGNAVYLQINNSYTGDSGWEKDSAKFAFYFFSDSKKDNEEKTIKIEAWSNLLDYRYTGGYGRVYEGKVPNLPGDPKGYTEWETMIAVRLNSDATYGTWDKKWNQSANLTIKSGLAYRNEAEVFGAVDGSTSIYTVGAGERLKYFAYANNWSKPEGDGSICVSGSKEGSYVSALSASWTASESNWDQLGADVQSYFSNVVANDTLSTVDGTGAGLAARYDNIVAAHGFENYASR